MKKKIIIICSLVILLLPISVKTNSGIGSYIYQTTYYWFDTVGNYIRANNTAVETSITGYTTGTADPKTLREKGFNPSNCSGWPPVPNDFDLPNVILYSHP